MQMCFCAANKSEQLGHIQGNLVNDPREFPTKDARQKTI